jgi:hypothetical protein
MPGTTRDEITEYIAKGKGDALQHRLAELRLEYSDIGVITSTYLAALKGAERIYPVILPIQASGRWSYLNPNLSGFPKKCINPECPKYHHEKTGQCWGVRDCIYPDTDTFWIEHDLDAVEHRIYALILDWKARLEALRSGIDIHTPVTCSLFNLPMCRNLFNPHTSIEDSHWRAQVSWQGKDDTRRTMSKNFTYGGQYFFVRLAKKNEKVRKPYRICNGLWYNPSYVYSIPNIQSYRILDSSGELSIPNYEELAVRFVEDAENLEIQKRKATMMEKCRKDKVSRTLYGAKRYGWFQNQDTAKELFNHIIQGTVASYIDESAILLQRRFPESYCVHNQHDSLKWAFPYRSTDREAEEKETLEVVRKICQRALNAIGNSIPITATFYIKRREHVSVSDSSR